MKRLWIVGSHFKLAPLETRAQLSAIRLDSLSKVFQEGEEYVLLNTCNRIELVSFSETKPEQALLKWLENLGLNTSFSQYFHQEVDQKALDYLFRVSASLESMVVGETQITGQVKRAYEEAVAHGSVGSVLHRVFQRALKSSKKVRSQTALGQFAVSIPSIGVKLAEKILGPLSSRRVAVLGLGEIGRVAAEHFATVTPSVLHLWNRTSSVAESIAQALRSESSKVQVCNSIDDAISKIDLIVLATEVPVLGDPHIQSLNDRGSPVMILDLGAPPSLAKKDYANLFLFDIDDLGKIAEENRSIRSEELEDAQNLIAREVHESWKQLQALSASEALSLLSEKADQFVHSELSELRQRLTNVKEQDWSEIEKMAFRISSRILQDPKAELRYRLELTEESDSWLQLFRSFFRI